MFGVWILAKVVKLRLAETGDADSRVAGTFAQKCHFRDCLWSPGAVDNWPEAPLDAGVVWATYPDVYKHSSPSGPNAANNFDI